MPKRLQLENRRFGRLTVLHRVENTAHGQTRWLCQCECGATCKVIGAELQSGHVKSCGCFRNDFRRGKPSPARKHNESATRLYTIWEGMKQRCYNPKASNYDRYGAKGITVCADWRNSFEAFKNWALEKGYDENLTIDRIDGTRGYCPENCRWATPKQQAGNRKRRSLH